jgi:hypothetical protein
MAVREITGILQGPILLRRLMIICPCTGRGVDTGYELTDIPAVALPHIVVDCTECGQDHTWRIEDAFAES